MLDVTLLGSASFSHNGSALKPDLGPAGRLLACYLFEFSGQSHRRERLADLFWGELEPNRARSALNTALWRIRKMLDFSVEGGARKLLTLGEDVLLEPASFIRVDTHVLQSVARRADRNLVGSELTNSDEDEIAKAIESYRGPFLDGEDADWILQERERLHSLFIRSALDMMRLSARRGHHERALEYGRRILAVDPYRENVQRDMMLLLVLNGQRADAIRSYQCLKHLLRSELDIDPMPDSERLSRLCKLAGSRARCSTYPAHFTRKRRRRPSIRSPESCFGVAAIAVGLVGCSHRALANGLRGSNGQITIIS